MGAVEIKAYRLEIDIDHLRNVELWETTSDVHGTLEKKRAASIAHDYMNAGHSLLVLFVNLRRINKGADETSMETGIGDFRDFQHASRISLDDEVFAFPHEDQLTKMNTQRAWASTVRTVSL